MPDNFCNSFQLCSSPLNSGCVSFNEVLRSVFSASVVVLCCFSTWAIRREIVSLFCEVIVQLMLLLSAIWGQMPYSDPWLVFTFPAGYHCIESKILLEKYPVLISRYPVIDCTGSPGKLFQWLITLADFLSQSVQPGS